MNLQTIIPLFKQSKNLIDYNSNILLLGSCFVENIGSKLDYFKFKNTQNPFGILFHPKAIETLLVNSVEQKVYIQDDIFFQNEQWHCFDAHSKLSNSSKYELLNELNEQIKFANQQIHESTHIVITLGTAWVYRFLESNRIVANCHKISQKQFRKELLSVEDILVSLKNILNKIRSVNNKASVLFTVSPIRHTKDGFIENNLSKAHLITAIHQTINQVENVFYFPSYEIMMDELRDYRFYTNDMIHPNETAINYIWDKFKTVWISDESLKLMEEIDTIQKGIQHKPFNSRSQAYEEFVLNLELKKSRIKSQFSHIVF